MLRILVPAACAPILEARGKTPELARQLRDLRARIDAATAKVEPVQK